MAEGKVIKYILCKLDGREYKLGEFYSGSPERIKELVDLGYLEDVQGETEDSKETVVVKKSTTRKPKQK